MIPELQNFSHFSYSSLTALELTWEFFVSTVVFRTNFIYFLVFRKQSYLLELQLIDFIETNFIVIIIFLRYDCHQDSRTICF